MSEQSIDVLVARVRSMREFDVSGTDRVEVRQRGALVARISRGSGTVDFPFPRTPIAGNSVARVLRDFPRLRKTSDGFALVVTDAPSVDTALRYLARRSRIERYAWQASGNP